MVLRPRLSVEFALYNLVGLTLADHGEKCIKSFVDWQVGGFGTVLLTGNTDYRS